MFFQGQCYKISKRPKVPKQFQLFGVAEEQDKTPSIYLPLASIKIDGVELSSDVVHLKTDVLNLLTI